LPDRSRPDPGLDADLAMLDENLYRANLSPGEEAK
jgi:hypothetical protein